MLVRLLTICIAGAVSLVAQDGRGRIAGKITDPSGAVVPNVDVAAVNTETGVKTTAVSNQAGSYDLPFLQPGTYHLTAVAAGFKMVERKQVMVRVAETLTVDIGMEVGQVTEAVQVNGQTSLLETSTASVGRVVDQRRILDLPLPGGNALSLARLAPGVVNLSAPNHPSLGPATEVMSSLTVNGVRSGNIEFTVDGTPSMWGTNAAYAPPTEMVAEFKVQTATYDASIGRAPGGNINVVLRSGGNQAHGALYFFHNNQHLQSLDLFQRQSLYNPATGPVTQAKINTTNPLNILNRYGATFSGPVYVPRLYNGHNRTFWVYSFEGLTRPGVERGNTFFTVPTAAERRGDFSQLLTLGSNYQIYDPFTTAPAPNGRFQRQPLAGNVIPPSRIDRTASGLLSWWPESNIQGAPNGTNNYQRLQTSWNEYRSHTVKIDHNFSEKQRLFGRYAQWFQLFSAGQTFPNKANGTDRYRYNYGGVLDHVYVVTPSVVNNIRLGMTRFEQSTYPISRGFDLAAAGFSPKLAAAIDPQAYTFPNLSVSGLQAIGTASVTRGFSNYFTAQESVSWSRGAHMIRFGAEFRVYREHNYDFGNMVPSENFASAWTGGPFDTSPAAPIGQGLASFLFGLPSGGQINVNDSWATQSRSTGFYVQDDWRLSRTLTLNLGLRYDYDSPLTERYNRSVKSYDFAAVNPAAAAAVAAYAKNPLPELPASSFKVLGGLTFAGTGGAGRNLWDGDRNNFSPRLGLAWNPRPSTVVRAGYGVFFVPLGADRQNPIQSGYSLATSLNASTDNGQTFVATLSDPFPAGWGTPSKASQGLATFLGRNISFFRAQSVNPYMQRWSLGVQQQLPGHFLLDASYIGNRGAKLAASRQWDAIPNSVLSTSPTRDQKTIDFLGEQFPNPFYPLPGSNIAGVKVARSQLLRPFPQFTGITDNEPQGYSWYHSLQAVLERRFQQGFTFQVNYTWSKMMEATGYLNPGDALPEKVISDLDRTQRLASSAIWELPMGKGKRYLTNARPVLRNLAGGWQLQLTNQLNSGPPIGFGNALVVDTIAAAASGTRALDQWFNIAAFARSSTQQLGSNLRALSTRFGGVRAAGVEIWDISAVKNFRIRERFKVQFRAEALNALNHSNLAAPNTDPVSAVFGKVNATVGFPRYLHFGLKVNF